MTNAATANFAAIGPKKPSLDAVRAISRGRIERYSLDEYLTASGAASRIVLCPAGRGVEEDLAFLRRARARLLWPAPPRDIADAIGGLVSDAPPGRGRPAPRRRGRWPDALLLEGDVTSARAAAALASPVRLWVVESVRRVRLPAEELAALSRHRVRWAALHPIELVGLLATRTLVQARPRWRRWLGARVPVWIAGGAARRQGA